MISRPFWIISPYKKTFPSHEVALFRMVGTFTNSRYNRKADRLLGRRSLNLTLGSRWRKL